MVNYWEIILMLEVGTPLLADGLLNRILSKIDRCSFILKTKQTLFPAQYLNFSAIITLS